MGTVFGKNTTSSSITVAGHKTYYIDSTDAEIVEVQKTSGQALPSVGDTVTFGNYPQATSTPKPIKWTVLAVDSVNGKALLLSKYILDAHVYNAEKVSVSWATCTLRDWINNTFYNAAFNSEEQSGIVTTHNAGSGLSSDDKVFCLTQNEAASYFPVEADRRAVATRKAIDDGASTASGYGDWWNLDWDVDLYYRADMISSSGGASGVNITVTWVGVRPAIWVSFSGVTITKYNAFKYTLSGTPYWYVIDGEHDTWTDDLSAWGYSEVQPGPVLPEVTFANDTSAGNWIMPASGTDTNINAGSVVEGYYWTGSEYQPTVYNSSKVYAAIEWRTSGNVFAGRVEFQFVNYNGTIGIKNNTSGSLTFSQAQLAACHSSDATVITVYNSSNVAYNAFKYIAGGVNYYYVLDGIHDTWTDDLSAWGYSEVQPAPVLPDVILMAYSGNEWNYPASFNTNPLTFVSGEQVQLYIASGTSFSYESDKVYSVGEYQNPSGTTTGRCGFSVVSVNSKIGCKNISGGSITIQRMSVYRCSDSTATVVTVYNSSNVAYNAFKFTANNVDYYYVLDGTQTDWTDDLSSIGYSLYGAEFDIDTNWGTAVSIPSGYSVQSVKASRAYAFGVPDQYSVNYINFHITGKDVYCADTDTSLLGCGVDPVISLFQIVTINSQSSYNGYHITYRSSQTTGLGARTIDYPSLNSGSNFVQLQAVNNIDNALYDSVYPAMAGGKPLIIRKYDSNGAIVSYYMNVPQTLWSFQNGVFSWLGDSASQSDLAYFYYNLRVRIHCVRI